MHLNDGQLRAFLDEESSPAELRHLESCTRCRGRLAEIQQIKDTAGRRLSFLADVGATRVPPASYELTRLYDRVTQKENRMQSILKFLKNRLVWGSAATIILVASFLSVPTMQAAAARLLAMFRVQQVTALPLDPSGLSKFTGDENLSAQMSQLISDTVVETKKAGDPREVGSAAEASEQAGFSVRLPQSESAAPALYVHDASAFEATIDRGRAQKLIDEAGRSDIVLPENIDGQLISAEIPAGVSASFGECPKPGEEVHSDDPDESPASVRQYPDCVMLVEYPSPTVTAPEDLDIRQLVQLGLEFTGMSSEEAQQVSESIDWTTTLVVPIPNNASSFEKVDVDGSSATLVTEQTGFDPHYLLMWVKDGIIYCISGWGSDSSRAIDMANSLQ